LKKADLGPTRENKIPENYAVCRAAPNGVCKRRNPDHFKSDDVKIATVIAMLSFDLKRVELHKKLTVGFG
jgi:hypothetical protein